jgi:hypothetical protein
MFFSQEFHLNIRLHTYTVRYKANIKNIWFFYEISKNPKTFQKNS